jgi:hypothetical protein
MISPSMETTTENPIKIRRRSLKLDLNKEGSKFKMSRVLRLPENRKYKNMFPQIHNSPYKSNHKYENTSSQEPDSAKTKGKHY